MLTNIDAVLFDLDGTLVDSMWLWKAIDVEYLGRFDIELPESLQSDIEGMSFTETANYFKERFNLPDSIEKIKNDWNEMAWEYYTHKVELKNGVLEFLQYLKDNNISIGIGTSNSKELVNLIVNKFNINEYFTSIRTSCEVEKGKPHPDIYLKVAQDLGVNPENCLVFEDIPNGILAGKNAGMQVCAIYDNFSKDITQKKTNMSDYYINDYFDIISHTEDDDNDKRLLTN